MAQLCGKTKSWVQVQNTYGTPSQPFIRLSTISSLTPTATGANYLLVADGQTFEISKQEFAQISSALEIT